MLSLCAVAGSAQGQLIPERLYYGVNRPIPMRVDTPTGAGDEPTIALYRSGESQPLDSASVADGRVDLGALFPVLWTRSSPDVLFAQLEIAGEPYGSAVVLQPLLTPTITTDQLTSAIDRAIDSADQSALETLLAMSTPQRQRLRRSVQTTPAAAPVYSGIRAWIDRHVMLETSAGSIELRLRPDHAPVTCHHFLRLVEGGFYDDTIIHRVIRADARGRPFLIQAGDPTGLGHGGPGERIDFEPSTLSHDYGVVSLARRPFDPNSGGSQFFICLSREACSGLDGQYVAFAEVVDGADALETISRVPVGPIDEDKPSSPHERPLDPPQIIRARSVPAPPFPGLPTRVRQPTAMPRR